MAVNDKYTTADKELQETVTFCFNHTSQYFEDRRRIEARFEGRRQKREARQAENGQTYISTAAADMIEQKAAFTTEAVTNFGDRMYAVGTYNNIEVVRDAKAASELLNFYMTNIPVSEQAYMLHKNMFKYGTAVLEVYHKTITRKEPDQSGGKFKIQVGEDGQFGSIYAATYKDVDDLKQPVFRQVRIDNFWFDPEIVDGTLDTARWVVTRQLLTADAVRKNKIKYGLRNLDTALDCPMPNRMKSTAASSEGGIRNRSAEYDVEAIIQRNTRNEATKKNPIVEVITIYKPGLVQFMVNGKIVSDELVLYPEIRFPFVVFRNQPEEGEFLGRSDVELVKNNVEFYEQLINLIQDKYLMNLKPIIFADASVMDSEQIEKYKKAKAGDVVAIDGFMSDGVKEFIQSAPEPTTIAFADGFLAEVKKTLAINPMMESENPGSGIRTEGSLQLFQRIGSTRVQTQLNIVTKCWEDVARLMLKMAKIFADEPVYLGVTGSLGDTYERFIDPRALSTNVKFKVRLSAIADPKRDTRIAQMMKYIELAANFDKLGLFRGEQALAETAEHIDFFNDPLNLWETDPEVIKARRELLAQTAGKEAPSSYTGFPSLAEYQAAQPPAPPQQAQAADAGQPAAQTQASDLPTATEGQPAQ